MRRRPLAVILLAVLLAVGAALAVQQRNSTFALRDHSRQLCDRTNHIRRAMAETLFQLESAQGFSHVKPRIWHTLLTLLPPERLRVPGTPYQVDCTVAFP